MLKLFMKSRNQKGFTLVELIVVLVILGILAAILVPTMIGWIDKSKDAQYQLEARSVMVACQGVLSEAYANNEAELYTSSATALGYLDDEIDEVKRLSGVNVDEGVDFSGVIVRQGDSSSPFTKITQLGFTFLSDNGGLKVKAYFNSGGSGAWEFEDLTTP